MLHHFPDLEQGSPEWHDQRRGIVTASVVGKLITSRTFTAIDYTCPDCAAGPYEPCRSKVKNADGKPIKSMHADRTAHAAANRDTSTVIEVANNDTSRGLTALLAAERITGWTDPTYVSDDMLRGTEDEPRAVATYSEHFAPVTVTGFMVRDDFGFRIGYSPDGLVGDDGLIEAKSHNQKQHLQIVIGDAVPPENMAQLQCGLLVSGRDWIDYLSYCGGMPMWRKRVEPDPRWFDTITAAVEQFESNAADMVAAFTEATAGLPATERVVELEMIL